MDELDLLKKDWNKGPKDGALSAKDIYPMLLKKSSSIVKTLFYISIAEFVFWNLAYFLPFFLSEKYKQDLEKIYTDSYIFTIITLFNFAVIVLFIYLLYKSYKTISVTDSAKKLMESIIKARKIVKYYVIFSLTMIVIAIITSVYYAVHNDPRTIQAIEEMGENGLLIYYSIVIVFSIILITVFWLIYRLIYGDRKSTV